MHRFASGYCTRSSKKSGSSPSKRHSGSARKRAARVRKEDTNTGNNANKSGSLNGSNSRGSQVEGGDASDTSEGSFAGIVDEESSSEAEIDADEFGLDL
jgi:hypothetical protein